MRIQAKQKYTAEFKENVVKRANESSNVAETARELGINVLRQLPCPIRRQLSWPVEQYLGQRCISIYWSSPLPRKRITRHQESLYMNKRQQGKSQETAACAAISERSGRRIEKGERASIAGERSAAHGLNTVGISGRRTCGSISLQRIAHPSASRKALESHAGSG